MSFKELNSVKHYIIHQLSGVNLNSKDVHEPNTDYGSKWIYKSDQELERSVNEVLVESELKKIIFFLYMEEKGSLGLLRSSCLKIKMDLRKRGGI